MNDEAYVRLVDAHAESDSCANHADFVANEKFLIRRARLRVETRMIRLGLDPVRVQTRCHVLRAISALAVNDPAIARPSIHKAQKLFVRTVFRQYSIRKIGPIKTGDVTSRLAQAKLI